MLLEPAVAGAALLLALVTRPWRLLGHRTVPGASAPQATPLLTPALVTLVLLPWLWALPTLHAMPLQLQWSGACLVVLMLGWPLAVPVYLGVGAIAWVISPMGWEQALACAVWLGIVPGTLALLLGALVRRVGGENLFVYVLGRGFIGTLAQWSRQPLPGVGADLSLVARWLMAWGDGVVTGMLCAVFVAFKPEWLATWSDTLYLHPPPP